LTPKIQYDEEGNRSRVAELRRRGVEVWSADRVFINCDVDLDAICPGAVLMNAVISGSRTHIGAKSCIGFSGTAFLHDACFADGVEAGSGTYTDCALLDGVKVRGCAEIRGGAILEEGVEIGHNVGLKNSILTCWTIAGSCINFCDVLVTGGCSREDHSEIGSGTVHLNFSPRRDKFASAFGDIRGVLLRSERIFVGGNCGIVAPCEVTFGEVIPAGTTLRHASGSADYCRKLTAGLRFIRNLSILQAWYKFVRLPFSEAGEKVVIEAAIRQFDFNLQWRVSELQRFLSRHGKVIDGPFKGAITEDSFRHELGSTFFDEYGRVRVGHPHTYAIRQLPTEIAAQVGAKLVQAIV
jgi:bifunctional UDP-N-acetylglucosamine pyrophosphorylase/glucosamine-1-phosphate N-acetyltransferase